MGAVTSISALIGILLALYFGLRFDRGGKWKIFPLAVACSILSLLSFIILPEYPLASVILFTIGNACYIASIPRYDSLLICLGKTAHERVTLSSWGWGAGYLGGIAILLIGLILSGSFPNNWEDHYYYFIPCSLFFIICSIPIRKIEDLRGPGLEGGQASVKVKLGLWYNMAALFFATEGMSAIMRFCAIFVKTELGISLSTIAILMIGAQLLAFPFTGLAGVVSKKIGVRITIMISLVLWILISIFFYMASTLEHIVIISILLSLVMGSTKSLLRGTMANLVPPAKTGFFYFIWGLANKTGSLIGPFLFGIMATIFDIRVAFLSLIPFFLIAIWTVKKMGSSRQRL